MLRLKEGFDNNNSRCQENFNFESENQEINKKSPSEKNVSLCCNENKSTKSYCRSILFHGKEIISYCTTSSINSNETMLCVPIKDIVSTYFPNSTDEQFIELCRSKKITRYKPDRSAKSDLSLRLININQLDQYWNFFIEQLLPKRESICSYKSDSNENNNENSSINNIIPTKTNSNDDNQSKLSSEIIKLNIENISEIVQSSIEEDLFNNNQENLSYKINSIISIDNQLNHIETNSSIDQHIEIREEKEEQEQDTLLINHIDKQDNQFIKDLSENKQDKLILSMIKKNILKKKRRRSNKLTLRSKRRKEKEFKSMINNDIQYWIKKYSIEPISIYLNRVNKPTN
ncbi:unnamed protein product [Rotaria sordida]|uniref:Uncharacterized protein n=2 Tax=Rotaria sordida TaxID=392033 RepID=A0A815WCN7_9BILA|nr:unnamed protein product [Rotaria sordida]